MLDHLQEMEVEFEPGVLLDPDDEGFAPLRKVGASNMLDAQMKTTEWMSGLGVADDTEVVEGAQADRAREAFQAMALTPAQAKSALEKVTVPAAVRNIVGMLSAYEWAFVEQAQQLRGMAVAKIVEETDHPDARIRLKALELLGKVTEVGLFTERIEIKKTELSNEALDAKIKEKLQALSRSTVVPEVVEGEFSMTESTDAAIN